MSAKHRHRRFVLAAAASTLLAACSAIWGFDDLELAHVDAEDASADGPERDGFIPGDAAMDIQVFDSARPDAPTCHAIGLGCTNAADCCSVNCSTTGTCDPPITDCKLPGLACTRNNECCTFSCVGGTCSNQQCVADSPTAGACSTSFDCCSQNCVSDGMGGGECKTTLPPRDGGTCRTHGNPCSANTDCCSGQCVGGLCNNASFCEQTSDVCGFDRECCTGRCSVDGGVNELGNCETFPGGGTICSPNGTLCTDAAAPDAAPNTCGVGCCSGICGPVGPTGVNVCQPPGGCFPAATTCASDDQCCGHAGSPSTFCAKDAGKPYGQCSADLSCADPGTRCKTSTSTCNTPNNCCEPSDIASYGGGNCNSNPDGCCRRDSLGIGRCIISASPCPTDGGYKPPGTACASSADCCGAPCAGNQCLAVLCVGAKETCQETSDCCGGLRCVKPPFSATGTCGGTLLPDGGFLDAGKASCYYYGQACTTAGDCCSGVPCSFGHCIWAPP